jgi:hypothetical protein
MKESQGWQVVDKWLRDRAYHSWVDPRNFKRKEEWDWAELNAYHSAEVARDIIHSVEDLIAQAEQLRKKERGELDDNKFKDMFSNLLKGGKKDA